MHKVVYLLTYEQDFDRYINIGIFSTKEKAEQYIIRDKLQPNYADIVKF